MLDDSKNTWVSIGIEPRQNGEFTKVINIEERTGHFLCFTKGEFNHLLKLIHVLPEMQPHNIMLEYDDDDKEKYKDAKSKEIYEYMSIEKTKWKQHTFTLKHLCGNRGGLFFDIKPLKRLLQIYKSILFVYNNIDQDLVKNEFFKVVEKARSKGIDKPIVDKPEVHAFFGIKKPKIFYGIDKQKVSKFLMEHMFEVFNFHYPTIAHFVAIQTQTIFEDYFEQVLKYDIENPH